MDRKSQITNRIMRKLFIMVLLAMIFGGASEAFARGGTSMDDCTPDSSDPECVLTLTITHSTFDTDNVVVHAGSPIMFSNKDNITHNIQIANEDDGVMDLGLQKPGMDVKTKLDKAGKYMVRCGIIPQTKMTITVK